MTIKVLIGVKFNENLKKISFEKQDFPKFSMMCLEIAKLQDIAPNTPDLLPRSARLAMRVDEPPLEIPAYGPMKPCFSFNC